MSGNPDPQTETALARFRPKRRTYWVEHPDGGGHWASNWEIRSALAAVSGPGRKDENEI